MESSEKPMARKLHLLDFCAFFFHVWNGNPGARKKNSLTERCQLSGSGGESR